MSYRPEAWNSIKLQRGDLIKQIKNAKAKDWAKVCTLLGLCVREDYGRGSHTAVYRDDGCLPEDRTCLVLTIVQEPYAQIQRDFFKKVLNYGLGSGKFTEDDMWRAFGVL
ncbi:MAG TPA: hypothetical protein VG102_01065, partial [Candidatus Paceibacterota bacterium]|nr:hypothetical protein [Candidatus Paceibacterota bacterium]